MTRLQFDVYGLPAPQGSKKFVGLAKSGRGILVESSKKVKPWREDVRAAALALIAEMPLAAAYGCPVPILPEVRGLEDPRVTAIPLDGPLRVSMIFTMPKPKSAPKRKRTWPDRTPDLSKLVRSTEDAIVSAGLIRDDARIVDYTRCAKVFPGEDPEALPAPGVRITIEVITGE